MPSAHDLLGAVAQGVKARVEEPLQGRLGAADVRLVGPGELAAADADVADYNRPARVADVQLQPAERIVVESLEAVDALAADETASRCRSAYRARRDRPRACDSCVKTSTIVPAGASIVKQGQPTTCSGNSNVAQTPSRSLALPAKSSRPPAAAWATGWRTMRYELGMRKSNQSAGSRSQSIRPDSASRRGETIVSFIAGICRLRKAQMARIGIIHRVVAGIVAARGRLVGAAKQDHRRDPRVVELGVGTVPAVGVQFGRRTPLAARKNHRLGWAGRCCTVQAGPPRLVGNNRPPAAILKLQRGMEQQSRLAPGPRSIADSIEQDLDADHVVARLQIGRQVHRIDVQLPRIAGGRPPLHPLSINGQPVAAVGRDPTDCPPRLLVEMEFPPEEDERVRQGAAARGARSSAREQDRPARAAMPPDRAGQAPRPSAAALARKPEAAGLSKAPQAPLATSIGAWRSPCCVSLVCDVALCRKAAYQPDARARETPPERPCASASG